MKAPPREPVTTRVGEAVRAGSRMLSVGWAGPIWSKLAKFLVAWFVLFPLVWIFLSSFKKPIDVRSTRLLFEPTFDNYLAIFREPFTFSPLIVNSVIICVGTVLVTVPLATMAAYALSRYTYIGRNTLLIGVLATQFLPPVVVILPFFIQFRDLGLLDTHLALIIVNVSRTLPFAIWLLVGFVDTLPVELEEAAAIDGGSEAQTLRLVVLPLIMPGVVTAAIFSFILSWNEFLYALLLTSENSRTVIIGLVNVVGERDIPWELMSAAGFIVMIPMILMSLTIRRYFVEGMTMGAVK